ncbi:hypothetical protein D3C72_2032490 [compost metagenome]
MPAHSRRKISDFISQAARLMQQRTRMPRQREPGASGFHPARVPIEQGDIQGALKLGQALAERRWRDVLTRGGGGNAAFIQDGHKNLKGVEVQARHGCTGERIGCRHGESVP